MRENERKNSMYHIIIHVVEVSQWGARVRSGTISLYSRPVYDGFCVLIDRTITQPSGGSSGAECRAASASAVWIAGAERRRRRPK